MPQAKRIKKSKDEDNKEWLLRDVADIYLKDDVDFQIVPPPNDGLYVPRSFITDKLGGTTQTFVATFHKIGPERHAVFPQPNMNPLLPSSPGAAGLTFASRMDITEDFESPWALFCKDRPSGGAVWRYMGDYRNRRCGTLTADQFSSQSQAVQNQWGHHISTAKSKSATLDVYVSMRARVSLRKAGIVFDDERVEQEKKKIREKQRTALPLASQDVIDALSRGDEAIDIIKMECISYDHEFVAEMSRRYDLWNPSAAAAARKRQKAEKTSLPRTKSKGKRVQKAPPRRSNDESGSDFAPESEEMESESDGAIRFRGRRLERARIDPPQSLNLGWDDELSDLTETETDEEGL
ncbi:hypothetical protein C8R47DRAFT_745030 [Mycena vitilis]|nr:hypothetical protein C8R47DRAFT_745030 [Mycena vitilis]